MNILESALIKLLKAPRDQLVSLRSKLIELSTQRDTVHYARPHRDDVKRAITRLIQVRRSQFQKDAAVALKPYTVRLDEGALNRDLSLSALTSSLSSSEAVPAPQLDLLLCVIAGDAIVKAMHQAVDEMPWEGEGLPADQRATELARLDDAMQDLRTKINQLENEMVANGISLPD